MSFITDLKFALRSLSRVKGLTLTVIITLALGIGANAAIFSVVRGVLLRPLVNDDEDRLIYIRQSAKGIGADNAAFSVPEIEDLRARMKTLTALGDFSTIDFTMVGLGEPRVVELGDPRLRGVERERIPGVADEDAGENLEAQAAILGMDLRRGKAVDGGRGL